MSVEKLQRVLWRIREKHRDAPFLTNKELKICIMHECGTTPITYLRNRRALITLGWLKPKNSKSVMLTGTDLKE